MVPQIRPASNGGPQQKNKLEPLSPNKKDPPCGRSFECQEKLLIVPFTDNGTDACSLIFEGWRIKRHPSSVLALVLGNRR